MQAMTLSPMRSIAPVRRKGDHNFHYGIPKQLCSYMWFVSVFQSGEVAKSRCTEPSLQLWASLTSQDRLYTNEALERLDGLHTAQRTDRGAGGRIISVCAPVAAKSATRPPGWLCAFVSWKKGPALPPPCQPP